LPVLYVLSIGPANVLLDGNNPPQWVRAFYYPLGLLAEHCKPFGDALGWYVELWMG
jgi:hypothetical protein